MIRNSICLFTIVILTLGCSLMGNKTTKEKSSEPEISKESDSAKTTNFYDTLVLNYIQNTNNELIKLAVKDKLKEEWLLDRIENTDTAKYFIFQIGHDVVDEGNTNPRFVTDGWIYIDSLTRKIYEYDLPNDSLIEWKK